MLDLFLNIPFLAFLVIIIAVSVWEFFYDPQCGPIKSRLLPGATPVVEEEAYHEQTVGAGVKGYAPPYNV